MIAAAFINALRLSALSVADLIERTRLWDALKQQCAVRALLFYLSTNQDCDVIKVRVNAFGLRLFHRTLPQAHLGFFKLIRADLTER